MYLSTDLRQGSMDEVGIRHDDFEPIVTDGTFQPGPVSPRTMVFPEPADPSTHIPDLLHPTPITRVDLEQTKLAIALAFIGWGGAASWLTAKLPEGTRLPAIEGWEPVATDDGVNWTPLHGGSDRHVRMRFRNAAGDTVDVAFALYANQGKGHEAGGFGQGALPLGSHWAWERPGPAVGVAKSDVIQAPGPERRLCLTWYRSGDLLTGSNLALRLHVMVDHLLLRRQATAVLILSVSDRLDHDPAAALTAFIAAAGPVDRLIAGMGG